MTLKSAARDALLVQSACNLSGVLRSFAEIVVWLKTQGTGRLDPGTPAHAICRLFAEQVAHLTGTGTTEAYGTPYSGAYDICKSIAEQPD